MTSKLQQAMDVATGEEIRQELEVIDSRVQASVSEINAIAAKYESIRSGLDADDVPVADTRFGASATAAKALIDGLPANERAHVDNFFAALGYTKT